MPNQENGTLKMAGNFMALLLTLAPPPAHGSVVCWEEGDQFLVAPLRQQGKSGAYLQYFGLWEMPGVLVSFSHYLEQRWECWLSLGIMLEVSGSSGGA